MIEKQDVNGRPATVAYLTRDFEPATSSAFDYAKVLFDDGEMVVLAGNAEDSAALDVNGFNRHREKHRRPIGGSDPEGMAEAAAFNKHRMKHLLPVSPVTMADEPLDDTGEPTSDIAVVPVKLQLVAWAKAIMILDASEVLVRDLIERELDGKTGVAAELLPMRSIETVDRLVEKIAGFREEAIKTAFRLVRDRLGNRTVLDTSLAKWAAYFAKIDMQAIEAAIRAGLVNGDDNVEIARKVVGTMALNGVDGVTEYTRHKLAHLGRAGIKATNLRNAGQTIGAFDHTRIPGPS